MLRRLLFGDRRFGAAASEETRRFEDVMEQAKASIDDKIAGITRCADNIQNETTTIVQLYKRA